MFNQANEDNNYSESQLHTSEIPTVMIPFHLVIIYSLIWLGF
jgi:hypothetical protein